MNAPGEPTTLHVAETASTNSDLLERVRAAAADGAAAFAPCLLVADRQTAGRGRNGRPWHAAAGASLTFSLAWPFERGDLSGLSLAVGVALADALEPAPAAGRIGVKWPNDLWLLDADACATQPPGRKLAGVLIETAPFGDRRIAVIGVGLNVAATDVAEASSGVACLQEIDAGATPASALARIAPPLVDALRRFEREGFAAFAARFAARDLLRGRAVVGEGADIAIEGVAAGVAPSGALWLETATGRRPVVSGEWRLRLAVAAGSPC
ncbi:MAG: biotin--[acetyl-CoA-carboxylase] ligase [Caldimonas sp.]